MYRLALLLLLSACSAATAPKDPLEASLKVFAAPTGSVKFTWEYTAGIPNPEIEGFRILLGTSSKNYTRTVDVGDSLARSFVVTGVDLGVTHYAVIMSRSTFGLLSSPTPEIGFGGTPLPPFQLKALPGNQ